MLIAKELALKVLGALAVGGTVIGGGVAINSFRGGASTNTGVQTEEEKNELREKGLECVGNYCTLAENKTLTVKHGDNNTTGTISSLPAGEGVGKIRVHKSKEGDKNKFSFSIEGGDITPNWQSGAGEESGTSISKLEEFETYEIEETTGENQQKNYIFKRKTNASDEIKKLLGLGECALPTGSNADSNCELDLNKLKAINFEGKSGDPTIAESGKATLAISGVSDMDKEAGTSTYHYPFDYIFKLSGDKEVKIPTRTGEIVKEAGGSVEFRIKVTSTTPGPKKLSLEKVWEVEKLAGKLGFTECKKESKTCKFPEKINVYKSDTESVKGAAVTGHTDKTISFEEGAEGHEEKIKFSLASPVSITGGTQKSTSSSITSIEKGNYEIKQQTVESGTSTWYLSKKEG